MNRFENDVFKFYETYSEVPENSAFDKHMHSHYELYYFLNGDADYIVGNTVYHLQPNDLLFIRPAVYHNLKLLSDKPYHRIVIWFTEEQISNENLSALEHLKIHYRIPQVNRINGYYRDCVDIRNRYEITDQRNCFVQILNLILTELKYCNCYSNQENPVGLHPILSKILAFIDENLNLPIDTHTLSEMFFVSPSWITHSFRKFLNVSPMEYVNRKKILYAQKLIAAGEPTMEVAEKIGYNHYATFFIQYKKILGVSPIESKPKEKYPFPLFP